jgi:phosphoribosylformimino-5-aminoimidazole carboxamide ribotide isomerase
MAQEPRLNFTVFPAVDISDGRCVRLLQGRFGTETIYSDDPLDVAVGFSRAGARWLHIVDLDGAKTGHAANRELVVEAVRSATCPVQAGGGVRTVEDVEELLHAGANRVVLGTFALEDPDAAKEVCRRFGPRIVVSLDARGGEVASHGWTVGTGIGVLEAVAIFQDAGAASFVYTDVSRDGTMTGPNVQSLLRVADATDLPIVASGGIGTLDELREVARLHDDGIAGAIVGRAFYEHKFSVGEANLAADEAASGRAEPPLVES